MTLRGINVQMPSPSGAGGPPCQGMLSVLDFAGGPTGTNNVVVLFSKRGLRGRPPPSHLQVSVCLSRR